MLGYGEVSSMVQVYQGIYLKLFVIWKGFVCGHLKLASTNKRFPVNSYRLFEKTNNVDPFHCPSPQSTRITEDHPCPIYTTSCKTVCILSGMSFFNSWGISFHGCNSLGPYLFLLLIFRVRIKYKFLFTLRFWFLMVLPILF